MAQLTAKRPELEQDDSVLFADFKDRSKQIMEEHIKIDFPFNKGGVVPMDRQMDMFADGGLETYGMAKTNETSE